MVIQNLVNQHVNEALHQMNQAEYGAHYMIVYPNLDTLRELYSNFVHKQTEEDNEIVLINPFYETIDSVRQVLSEKYNDGINDVSKHEKEKSLMIIDSLEEYFGQQPDMDFKRSLVNYAKEKGKNGLSILGDIGAYPHKSLYKNIVDYESSLPMKYDAPMKGFCLYHQKDFDRFSDEQKQRLVEHHGKALKIMEYNNS